jgi:hypothetical protein
VRVDWWYVAAQEARHRIELLSTELSNAKEHAAREASRYEQTTELIQMLREAHASLAASNDSLRKECDALHNRYNMDADQWKVHITLVFSCCSLQYWQPAARSSLAQCCTWRRRGISTS